MTLRTKVLLGLVCLACSLILSSAQCNLSKATPKLSRAIYDFTANLIKEIAEEHENHFVVSPVSLWTLLAATAEGAKGQTYEELRQSLHLHRLACFNDKYYKLTRNLTVQAEMGVNFKRSALIAVDDSFLMKTQYAWRVEDQLQLTRVDTIDFHDSVGAAMYVNRYIDTSTGMMIDHVVDPQDFEDVVMMLVDAVYFRANWNVTFDPDRTVPSVFYDERQNEIGQLNLMQVEGMFHLTEMSNIRARVLELPYGSKDRFAMLVFLPNDDVELSYVINNLYKSTLAAVYHKFRDDGPVYAEVYLPRFKIESELKTLKEHTMALGVKRLFDPRAELGGISDQPHFISKIVQKATIVVTETGTEASAATVEFAVPRSIPELFQANKPFLFLILEKYTKTVLFAGAYSKPTLD